ncbi:MAG: exodeoxyribonuclease VII large subunit [Gammaproteobacteria bacterium]|jgi:exodeoxyribonuclease VII large subunit
MGPDAAPRDGPGGGGILSVSELNRAVASLLERSIPPLWVAGEISNFTRAASGHWYFTLKDAGAQVRAVMFRGRAQGVGFVPREGDRVEVRALAGLYQPRGDFQLGVEQMRRAGAGDLYQRFLQLREKLRAEGLLDETRKRALPPLPSSVGVVTSLQAAALRDVLATLAARAPQVPVILYPTPVQGAEAPAGIVAALRAAARRAECDVLLLVRGGGSIEDLWSFNDEAVARAVAASPIPVVCGVGHESDFTIADFVADLRAPTPTAAAALAVPDRQELLRRVDRAAQQLAGAQDRLQALREQRVDTATRLLRSPSAYLDARGRHLDGLARRAAAAAAAALHLPAMRLARASTRLRPPDTQERGRTLESLCARLARGQSQVLQRRAERADALVHKLELVSPQAVLGRGYAIVRRQAGEIVRSPAQVSPGERLDVLLAEGAIEVDVSREADRPRP